MPYADLEKRKQQQKLWYRKNRKRLIKRTRKRYANKKETLIKKSIEWAIENPEKRELIWRRSSLKSSFWTPEDWDKAYKEQKGVCAVCGSVSPNGRRLSSDHDHDKKTPRGLLCCLCNFMIGNARDNPDILEAGAQYLRKYSDAAKENYKRNGASSIP